MKKHLISVLSLHGWLCIAGMLLLCTCFNPLNNNKGETTLSITLPGASSGTNRAAWNPTSFIYEVSGIGPGGQNFNRDDLIGGQTVTVSVAPGQWQLRLLAKAPSTPPGECEADSGWQACTVIARQNNRANMPMRFCSTTYITDYLNDVGGTLTAPASLRLALELDDTAWGALFTAIDIAGVYVDLDLSACTRASGPVSSGLGSTGEFNPDSTSPTGKDKIISLILPEAANVIVGSFGPQTFHHFSNLMEVKTGNGITVIGQHAFDNTTNDLDSLTSVIFGDSVHTIEFYAFECVPLVSLTLPNSLYSIGTDAFSRNNNLTSLTIPNSVITIGDNAFFSNIHLQSVTIGSSVNSIGALAFSTCDITSIVIPDSVTSIGAGAFDANSSLTSVTIGADVTLAVLPTPSFPGDLDFVYTTTHLKQAGTYTTLDGVSWSKQP